MKKTIHFSTLLVWISPLFGKTRLLVGLLILSLIFSCREGRNPKKENSSDRPNVIFIVIDDMSADAFGGSEKIITPNIDKLCENSVFFKQAYCAAPVSIPSRASFFTGISPHKSGVYLNGGDPWNDSEVLKEAETLPELFKRNGYYTFGRGKIYHKPLSEGRIERNFDNRPIYEGGFGPFPDEQHRVFSDKDKFPEFWGVQSFPDSIFPDIKNTNAVIDFLEEKSEKPFFIALGLWRPHTPFTAPQRFFDLYNEDDIEIPESYKADDLDDVPEFAKSLLDPFGRFEITGANNIDRWKHFIHGYYACSSFVDWNIGRVMDALKGSNYADNTIVVVFLDNGFHIGSKNHWEKNTLWETSALTPMVIKMPSGFTNTVESPVGLIDIYPTMVDICNLKSPSQELDGSSLRKFMEQKDYSWDKPATTYFGENMISIRNRDYRFIEYPDGSTEFYDLKHDPFEFKNLSEEPAYKNQIEELKQYVPDKFAKELPGRRN